MEAKGQGWIVNISGGGGTGPRPMFTAYGAAKTALVRFSETLAIETAPYGIRVNAVAPAAFASRMSNAVLTSEAEAGAAEVSVARSLFDRGDETSAEKAARLVTYLTLGAGRDITGKLISAVWDRWDALHRTPDVLAHKDIFTLRRVVPEERNLKLEG
jgi:3-oxoacyl-[acyl-carrier protein] reductase